MDRLHTDQRLGTGEELTSNNSRVRLVMQGDGNLVLYRTDDGAPLWSSDTWQQPGTHAVMQGDGNFVLYTAEEKPLWATHTDGNPGSWIVLQDDGNLVLYSAANLALWASGTVQRFGPASVPGFLPSTRAPLFRNGPWPPGTALQISLPGLPGTSVDATEMGLCGGMSFLARDIHESGAPQLRGQISTRIPLELAQYILGRLIDSFNGPALIQRWLAETQALDHETVFWGPGLFHRTIDEVPGILDDIDRGILCPIGLVLVRSYAPWDVFKNHVVLVWGYERHGDVLTLRVYDCNEPGKDDIVIQLDISSHRPAKSITTNGTDGEVPGQIRGFFRIPYAPADPGPAYVDGASVRMTGPLPTPMGTGARSHVTITAENSGSTTWTVRDHYRLGSQAPQDNTVWGTGRVELPQASVDPGNSAVFQFDITAPAAPGRYAFCWQMVREGVRWFGQAGPRVNVAVGSTSGVCDELRVQYEDFAQQLDDVLRELEGIDWSDPYEARREATRLNKQARTLRDHLDVVERNQQTHGCAPS